MNDNAKKWVAALRSGEFEQGRGYLQPSQDKHCCLGVACEIYMRSGGNITTKEFVADGCKTVISHSGRKTDLPWRVKRWLGLRKSEGYYGTSSLVSANDHGMTFTEIADLIESEPEGLFCE
jgi:hypothetical protein